jgi:hypothetical protein
MAAVACSFLLAYRDDWDPMTQAPPYPRYATLSHLETFLSTRDCGIANVNIGTSGAEIG